MFLSRKSPKKVENTNKKKGGSKRDPEVEFIFFYSCMSDLHIELFFFRLHWKISSKKNQNLRLQPIQWIQSTRQMH